MPKMGKGGTNKGNILHRMIEGRNIKPAKQRMDMVLQTKNSRWKKGRRKERLFFYCPTRFKNG